MTERAIRQYCHAVGNYLPCPRKQRQHILQSLRLRLEEYRAEHAEDSVTPEEQFSRPQQVAAVMWMIWTPPSFWQLSAYGGKS